MAAKKKAAPKKTATAKAASKKAAPAKANSKAAARTATRKSTGTRAAKAAPKASTKAAATKRARKTPGATKAPGLAKAVAGLAKVLAKKAVKAVKTAPGKAIRAVPKISPQRGADVETWLTAKAKGWQGELIREVIALVQKTAPGTTMAIKWAQPVFEHHGPFAFVRPAAKHVTLGFWRGADLGDPTGVLEGSGSRMAHLKLKQGALDRALITGFVKQAVAMNAAKGDPTKR